MRHNLFLQRRVQVPLCGYVDRRSLRSLVRAVERYAARKRGVCFVFDCSQVQDFCGYALADLVELRRRLQWQGADLELADCPASVRDRLAVPLFESLMTRSPSPEAGEGETALPDRHTLSENRGPQEGRSFLQAPHFLFRPAVRRGDRHRGR
jgi:ABC-type transporter Mla MlaB component